MIRRWRLVRQRAEAVLGGRSRRSRSRKDGKDFDVLLQSRGDRVSLEMHYYEQPGHSFYNYTRLPGSDPGFDFRPGEAALARRPTIDFLRRHM